MGLGEFFLAGNLLLRLRKKLDMGFAFFLRNIILRREKIQDNKIIFMTYDDSYSCNPGYISDELIRRGLDVDVVWVSPNKKIMRGFERLPEEARVVRRNTIEMFKEQASSKIWIDNALSCVWYGVPKRKEQVYINTWHGSMGIKKIDGQGFWLNRAKKCAKVTDYCIANSTFEEDVYANTFWKGVKILPYGHARNDVLFDKKNIPEIKKKVREELEIDENKKMLLYAPTFRDSGDIRFLNVDFAAVKKALEKRFGSEWVILVRVHYKNRSVSTSLNAKADWVINATDYSDMQDLIIACDAGITDYSSWAYDYILTKKPMFLYVPDVEKYDFDRGFYFSTEQTPFHNSHNNAELVEGILNFEEESYNKKIDEFLEDKGCYEQGDAAKKAVDFIESIINESKK